MAVTPADQDQAFLREVDENLRADQLADFWRRYGRLVVGAIVAGLMALAGVLWWQHHQQTVAGEQGEQLQAAFDKLGSKDFKGAGPALADLSKSGIDGYRAAALMSQSASAVEASDTKTAIAKLSSIAGDSSLDQSYRDVALIKQTMLEFDSLPPASVIARMRPLAVKDGAFYGSAGELVALAQLKLGKRAEAGRTFSGIAKDAKVPDTIRQRAVQLAGVLGVDAVDQGEGARGFTAGRKGEGENTK